MRFPLGRWRGPLCAVGLGLGLLTPVVPVLVLAASSLAPQAGAFFPNWNLHFWQGDGGGPMAQRQAGLFRNPVPLGVLWHTPHRRVGVALIAMGTGLAPEHTNTTMQETHQATV